MTSQSTQTHTQSSVIIVGCGSPNRGMGWYHGIQLLDNKCPSANLQYVVEPWFLGAGKDTPGGKEFHDKVVADWSVNHGVKFLKSLYSLPVIQSGEAPRLALISGRTADNPRLLTEAIDNGVSCIYLEKPGATCVKDLEKMKVESEKAGVEVLMGYNKNVCKYVRKTREFASTIPNAHVTFVSNNAYENTPESLGECFERNCEGMLKNMAIHELALLVSFYDVSVDNIDSVLADTSFSSMQTLTSNGKSYTDFDKIKFTIFTKNNNQVSVQADRCGGSDSYATVRKSDDVEDKVLFRYNMPDEQDETLVKELTAKYPTAMPYFFTQDPDYITVKERVAKHTVDYAVPAEGIATIDVAIETLKVAEYLTPILQEQLKN